MKVDAINGFPIHNISTSLNYATIQSAINAIQTVDGNTIRVDAGTYTETLQVSKDVSITGDNPSTTIINGQVTISYSGAKIFNFTLNGGVKILPSRFATSRCTVSNNIIIQVPNTGNGYGIDVFTNAGEDVDYGIIEHNEIRDFSHAGIQIVRGNHWTISGNDIHNNGGGIILYSSDSCTITENSIHNNTNKTSYYEALHFEESSSNVIYHNDLFDNPRQVYVFGYPNKWDNGGEGNYWGDYHGTDSNGDGIGDTPYVIDSSNQDNFPLMHMYLIPEFQSFVILPLLMIATLLAVMVYKKKGVKTSQS
jgi:parallel beta-helix repeat protein